MKSASKCCLRTRLCEMHKLANARGVLLRRECLAFVALVAFVVAPAEAYSGIFVPVLPSSGAACDARLSVHSLSAYFMLRRSSCAPCSSVFSVHRQIAPGCNSKRCCQVCMNGRSYTGKMDFFDFESAAEDSSDEVVTTETATAVMMQKLREEAAQFLDEPMLRAQMQKHVMSRFLLDEIISSILASKLASADLSEAQLFETLVSVMRRCPQLALNAVKDLEWCRKVDPATIGFLQPLLYFKGCQAVLLQRIVHQLWISGNTRQKMLALALQGRGSEVLGVDAHPGAVIKHAVMLDHATGIVIGETGTIGYNCYILHGVTLGSTGKGDAFDRHPKIGNGVRIGAGAKILGNIKIGNEAFVGAGAIVTVNVQEGETVVGINRVLDAKAKSAATSKRPSFAFATLDTDGDGRITRSQYYACFDLLDANGDGLVTRAEFNSASGAPFSILDKNGDGFLSRDEWNASYDFFDTNKDGFITAAEFESIQANDTWLYTI